MSATSGTPPPIVANGTTAIGNADSIPCSMRIVSSPVAVPAAGATPAACADVAISAAKMNRRMGSRFRIEDKRNAPQLLE